MIRLLQGEIITSFAFGYKGTKSHRLERPALCLCAFVAKIQRPYWKRNARIHLPQPIDAHRAIAPDGIAEQSLNFRYAVVRAVVAIQILRSLVAP